MDVIKAEIDHVLDVVFLLREVVRDMNSRGFYHWNTGYPNPDIIEKDIKIGNLFMVLDNYACIGMIVMNDEMSPEFNNIKWNTNAGKVLYIHRLAVHPLWRGKGVTEKMLGFAEKYGKENGYTSLRLDVYDLNDHRINILKNRKFNEAGQILLNYQKIPFTCYEKGIE